MELSLKDREWTDFLFVNIFDIKKGFYNKKPESSNKGKIPFLGATANNNGLTEFYTIKEIENNSKIGHGKNEELSRKIFKGNCIAVTNNGSVGYAFYQAIDFTCSHDVNPLYLRNYKLNKLIAKFLIAAIEKQRVCFEYARKWRPIRMVKSKILLPINSKGEPDYEFMEAYMRAKEQEKIASYKNYIQKRISELENTKEVVPLSEKDWGEFELSFIFTIEKCKCSKVADLQSGNMPYVGATNRNNGVKSFVKPIKNLKTKGNCIAFICDGEGSVGFSIYKKEDFIGSTTVKVGRNEFLNKYIGTFITTIADTVRSKYNFGFKRNETHLKNEKIILPLNNNHEPDYEYMENYMKQLELNKLKKYLDYKELK